MFTVGYYIYKVKIGSHPAGRSVISDHHPALCSQSVLSNWFCKIRIPIFVPPLSSVCPALHSALHCCTCSTPSFTHPAHDREVTCVLALHPATPSKQTGSHLRSLVPNIADGAMTWKWQNSGVLGRFCDLHFDLWTLPPFSRLRKGA